MQAEPACEIGPDEAPTKALERALPKAVLGPWQDLDGRGEEPFRLSSPQQPREPPSLVEAPAGVADLLDGLEPAGRVPAVLRGVRAQPEEAILLDPAQDLVLRRPCQPRELLHEARIEFRGPHAGLARAWIRRDIEHRPDLDLARIIAGLFALVLGALPIRIAPHRLPFHEPIWPGGIQQPVPEHITLAHDPGGGREYRVRGKGRQLVQCFIHASERQSRVRAMSGSITPIVVGPTSGLALKVRRQACGIQAREVARRMGVSRARVASLEGARFVTPSARERYLVALGDAVRGRAGEGE